MNSPTLRAFRFAAVAPALSMMYGCTDYTCEDTATCLIDSAPDAGTSAGWADSGVQAESTGKGHDSDETRSDTVDTSAGISSNASGPSDASVGQWSGSSDASTEPPNVATSEADTTTAPHSSNDDTPSSESRAPGFEQDASVSTSGEYDGGIETNATETPDVDAPPRTVQVVAGGEHTCALSNHGKVRCWGHNLFGQLGYGNTDNIGDDEHPATAGDVDVGGTVGSLSAGGSHTCALLENGNVRCWGNGTQLGYGDTDNVGDNESPATAGDVNVGGIVVGISAGNSHTCAVLDDGRVRCWGNGTQGQLGYGNIHTIGDDEAPASAGDVNVGGAAVGISAGYSHTCALLDSGRVRCWGSGASGRLGYGNINNIGDNEAPATAGDVNVGGAAVGISAGQEHTCALLSDGRIRCWGEGSYGQLGYGNTDDVSDDETPASAGDVNVGATAVNASAGGYYTCALLANGEVRCWGLGGPGQLGYGNTNSIGDDEHPVSAGSVNVGGTVTTLTTNLFHTCVSLSLGGVECWGLGRFWETRLRQYEHRRRYRNPRTSTSRANLVNRGDPLVLFEAAQGWPRSRLLCQGSPVTRQGEQGAVAAFKGCPPRVACTEAPLDQQ